MSTTIVTPKPAFDAKAYIDQQNAKEHGTPGAPGVKVEAKAAEPEIKPDPKPDAKPATAEPAEPETVHMSRSQRRTLRRLGEAEGRAEAYKEIIDRGLVPAAVKPAEAAPVDPEPTRDKFATDAEYHKALGAWSARQETAKTLTLNQQTEQFHAAIRTAAEKEAADIALIGDWEEIRTAAAEDERLDCDFSRPENQTFVSLMALSPVRAEVEYHFCKIPDDFAKIIGMKPTEQIAAFHRLEGRVEGKYAKKTEAITEKTAEKKPTQAELDAKKAKPSESVSVRSTGGAAPQRPAPYLEDGKTVNPAWTAWRNERDARR